jgi:Major intrinsic protein/Ion channel
MNPARTLGPDIVGNDYTGWWIYIAGPVIGAAIAGIASIWAGLVLLFAVVLIVHRVLSFGTVTIQSIYGALSAYLITGLMFAAFYAALNVLGGDHFFANGQPASTQTFQYFSFTTLTTLGYGDFTAAALPRLCARRS